MRGSASASSAESLSSPEGWDAVCVCHVISDPLSPGLTKSSISFFFFFPPQLKLEDRSVVPRDVVRHMSSSVSAFFLVPF